MFFCLFVFFISQMQYYPDKQTKWNCSDFSLYFHLPTIAINKFLASFSPCTELISTLFSSVLLSLVPSIISPAIKPPSASSHCFVLYVLFFVLFCSLQHHYLNGLTAPCTCMLVVTDHSIFTPDYYFTSNRSGIIYACIFCATTISVTNK